jgi:hypothetical protein
MGILREATVRDFLLGKLAPDRLAAEAHAAVEAVNPRGRRVHIEDLPAGEAFAVTAPMLVRLCDACLTGALPAPDLETVAFAIVSSDHLRWGEDDELVGRVLYDWASPEITWELTRDNLAMFREWLTGQSAPPSEPEMTPDSLSALGFLRRTTKVQARQPGA